MIIAIDPGKSGGIAMCEGERTSCVPMPDTDGDVIDLLRGYTASTSERICYIEKVGGYCRSNQRTMGSAMFGFGHGRGVCVGALMAFGWKMIEVTPQAWQKRFSLGTRSACACDSEWKNKLKAEAQRRFPNMTVTLKTSDALLILDYAIAKEKSV